MDDQEQARVKRWFDDKWRHGECPVCHANVWGALPKLGQIENLDTGLVFGPQGLGWLPQVGRVPVLLISCQNCGYILQINALVAGIRQVPSPESSPSDGDE